MNYVDTPQVHSLVVHHSADCSVCTFASQSITINLSAEEGAVVPTQSEKPSSVEPVKEYPSLFTKEFPRRGPPALLS